MKFHCSIPGFNFQAYEAKGGREGGPALDITTPTPVAMLERKVGPGVREREVVEDVEVIDGSGKSRREIRKRNVRERVSKLSTGRSVLRQVLEVEADSEPEAEAIFRKAVGLSSEGTSKKVEVKKVESSTHASAPAPPKGKGKVPSADEAARAALGGKVPLEE